ncbi:MAG TPA: hypothetical protein VGE27_18745 [Gemmatimonas sp.]|uniref:hypothetical protein n=1 Tax=Gemmatimonas sp. TaxID=1962908 RepID=UPI002EDA3870
MSVIPDLHDDAHLRRVLFAAGILLLVIPAVQVVIQVLPLQLSNIQWRFAAANALSGGLLLPNFLGLTLLLTIARRLGQPGLQRVVGILAALYVLGLGASLALFALDASQLKAIVSTQMATAFRNTTLRVSMVSVLFLVSYALLAVAAFLTPKGEVKARREKGGEEVVGLIVGQ